MLDATTDHSSDEHNLVPDTTQQPTAPPTLAKQVTRVLICIAIYLVALVPIVFISYRIPSTCLFSFKLHSQNHVYYDDWYQSWPWSKFILWEIASVFGYTYVAGVTERRSNPFHSRRNNYKSFVKFLIASPIVFLMSPVRALVGPDDSDFSVTTAFLMNFFAFCVPYFIGLQFTYLDYNLWIRSMGDKAGTPSLWKTYRKEELFVMIPIVLAIVAAAAWHIALVVTDKLYGLFLIFYFCIFLIFAVPYFILCKTHYLHLHHFAIFGLLIPLSAFQNPFSLICLGLLSGIYVEGMSRWGFGGYLYRGNRVL